MACEENCGEQASALLRWLLVFAHTALQPLTHRCPNPCDQLRGHVRTWAMASVSARHISTLTLFRYDWQAPSLSFLRALFSCLLLAPGVGNLGCRCLAFYACPLHPSSPLPSAAAEPHRASAARGTARGTAQGSIFRTAAAVSAIRYTNGSGCEQRQEQRRRGPRGFPV